MDFLPVLFNFLALLLSYLIGSISTSIITSKILIKDDLRNHGSGNAGATNALRTLGKKGAIIVVIGDALKAVIAILITKVITKNAENSTYIAALGTVLGHNFPIYFGFRGGKGIIVSLIAILFADWRIGIITAIISIAIMAITKYVSLGSIIGAVIFFVLSLVFQSGNSQFIVFSAILALLAIYMHRSNIVRLINKTENKLNFKK